MGRKRDSALPIIVGRGAVYKKDAVVGRSKLTGDKALCIVRGDVVMTNIIYTDDESIQSLIDALRALLEMPKEDEE